MTNTKCVAIVGFVDAWRGGGASLGAVRPSGQLQRLGDEDALVQPLQLLKRYGTAAEIQDFATKHAMRYLLLAADEEPARRSFGRLNLMMGLPVTLVVDRSGIIRRRLIGPQTREAFEAAVRGVS